MIAVREDRVLFTFVRNQIHFDVWRCADECSFTEFLPLVVVNGDFFSALWIMHAGKIARRISFVTGAF